MFKYRVLFFFNFFKLILIYIYIYLNASMATNNVALIGKHFYASEITKELGLANNEKIKTYKEIKDLFYNDIVNKKISDL